MNFLGEFYGDVVFGDYDIAVVPSAGGVLHRCGRKFTSLFAGLI